MQNNRTGRLCLARLRANAEAIFPAPRIAIGALDMDKSINEHRPQCECIGGGTGSGVGGEAFFVVLAMSVETGGIKTGGLGRREQFVEVSV